MPEQRALRIHDEPGGPRARIQPIPMPDPRPGEVAIRVAYSSLNYKDALALTGRGKVIRSFPRVGGIDAAGWVSASRDDRFREGESVLVTGWGLGVEHDGGYAQYLCVPADWVTAMPDGLDPRAAMRLGTAGFTAALAIARMELNGQTPERGPIVVTGASGGVGCIAIDLLAGLGYEVVGVSGKDELRDWLIGLGATRVLGRDELPGGDGPLEKAVWGGAIDAVGGRLLSLITRTTRPAGNIASIGLAGGHELATTVMPFILRGINLLGIDSVRVSPEVRVDIWQRLASNWRLRHPDEIETGVLRIDELPEASERMLDGRMHGRVVVELA